MPTPDFIYRRLLRDIGGRSVIPGLAWLAWTEALKRRKRKSGKGRDLGGVPVEPDRPQNLTGGAAAELHFED